MTTDYIIGMPPDNVDLRTNLIIEQSMPVASIMPSKPEISAGLTVFRLKPAWKEYSDMLKAHGVDSLQLNNKRVRVAYIADSFPTDTFGNEYGESFIQKLTDVASHGLADLTQFFGAETGTEAIGKAVGALKGTGAIGEFAQTAWGEAQKFGASLKAQGGEAGGKIAEIADAALAGQRVDFPQVWRGSNFQPSYTMTIRLYNPNPASASSTKKYITDPLTALLLLGLPRSENSDTYNWPFFHRIVSPGIYNLSPAFISSITVIKGGDQQQIAYNQRMGIVDVRIDFGSLYSSMIAETNPGKNAARPTLKGYIDALTTDASLVKSKSPVRETITSSSIEKSIAGVNEKVPGQRAPDRGSNQASSRDLPDLTETAKKRSNSADRASVERLKI